MPRRDVTDMAWLTAALTFGLRMSKDPQRKLGACVVGLDSRRVAFGYNGLPAGIDDSSENWSRPRKYDLVIHAEENALASAQFDVSGGTVYCSLRPCHLCMGRMLNARIGRVVWLEDEVPFALQNAEVWQMCASMMTVEEYRHDDVTRAIKALAAPAHDGYGMGGYEK